MIDIELCDISKAANLVLLQTYLDKWIVAIQALTHYKFHGCWWLSECQGVPFTQIGID